VGKIVPFFHLCSHGFGIAVLLPVGVEFIAVALNIRRMAKPTVAQRVQALKAIPLFENLSQRSLQRIVRMSTEVEVPAGRVLIQPRLEGSGLYVVEDGTVEVERSGRKVKLGPGEFIGELALLTSTTRTARVRAVTPVRCLAISRADFGKMLQSEPKLAIAMLEALAKRLAESPA
jgi:CRP-like cAMP-binding protein